MPARQRRQPTALRLHLVRRLPGPDDHFADPAHRLAVARHHREDAHVVQHVFGGDRLAPDPALGEGQVFGDGGVEVMADHQHVQVLVDRVHGVRHGRVRRRRQHVREAGDLDDVGRVATARAFGVEGGNRTALEGGDGVFDEARFVERVGVDRHLDVMAFGHRQAGVDRLRRRAPVLVQLQGRRPRPRSARRARLAGWRCPCP